jgi:hypothetical protein
MLKIGCVAYLALIGPLLTFGTSAIAGPKDNYGDQCKYKFESLCLTQRGRVLDGFTGALMGYLGKDYTIYRAPYTVRAGSYVGTVTGGYTTNRYDQVNNGDTVVRYECPSDAGGSCKGQTTKTLYQYSGAN